MTEYLEYRIDDGVAVLSLAPGPGGRPGEIGAAARAALAQALDRVEADGEALGVVLSGQGRSFPGDLPAEEIASGEASPTLSDICRRIADFPKPVVAALRGEIGDGGLALALAAQARLAAAGTRLRLRAIRRGLVPGGGVTQRLPQLVGAAPAIEMIFAGRVLAVESGHLRGLCRRIVPRNVVAEAARVAREMAGEMTGEMAGLPAAQSGLPPGLSDPIGYQEALAARRASPVALPPEAEAALKCIEAAQLLPLEAGLAMEDDLRAELRGSARARGLIRATALEMGQQNGAAAPPSLVVLGDGAPAQDLARRALAGGLGVTIAEQRQGGAQAAIRRIAAMLEQEVAQGRISEAARAARLEHLSGGPSAEVLAGAAVVIEACAAPIEALAGLRDTVRAVSGSDVVLLMSSNAAAGGEALDGVLAPRVFGLGLSPHPGLAGQRGLAEIAVNGGAEPAAVAQAASLMRALDYGVAICRARPGLIAGRLRAAMLGAAVWCLDRGAGPRDVDAALGWPVGPFHQADAEGLSLQAERFEALGFPPRLGRLFESLVQAGRHGRATGSGVFSYAQQGAAGDDDKAAEALIAEWRSGGEHDAPNPATIRRRVWSALFCTGLRLLDEGVVADAGEIDLAGLEALGLPRASGGPMKTAEIRGLLAVKRELEAWQADDPVLWARSERLTGMVKNGEGFGT